jgi:hypothetical protein
MGKLPAGVLSPLIPVVRSSEIEPREVASSLCSAHCSVHRVPMRGDLLQGAGSGPGGCLQALDDPLDVSQARLDGVEHSPKALQLLGKNFVLGAFGSHDGEPDFIAAASRFRGLRARREARSGGRRYRAP